MATFVNGIAAVYFIAMGMASWPDVLVMAVGAIIGGVGGAGVARQLGRTTVRRIVIVIGFSMAAALMVKI
jgi:uncharacterized membrane protein YfcA